MAEFTCLLGYELINNSSVNLQTRLFFILCMIFFLPSLIIFYKFHSDWGNMKKNLVLKNNKSIKEPLKRNRWIWPISVLLSNRLFANDLSFLILTFFYTIFLASQNAAPVKQIEPIFHTVPPRPMRLLHSETYIRYI